MREMRHYVPVDTAKEDLLQFFLATSWIFALPKVDGRIKLEKGYDISVV